MKLKSRKKFRPERVGPRSSAIPVQCSGHFVNSLRNVPHMAKIIGEY